MYEKISKKKRITITIDTTILEKIKQDAAKKKILPQHIVVEIIEKYTNFHRGGFVPIRSELLLMLLDKYAQEEIENISSNMVHSTNKETILNLKGEFDVSSALKTIKDWLDLTNFVYSYEVKDSKHKFVILHDLGIKWSLYLAKLFAGTASHLGFIPEYDYTDKILLFSVNLKEKKLEKKRTDKQIALLGDAIAKHKSNSVNLPIKNV